MITLSVDLSRFDSPIHRDMNLIAQLKNAGIPVIGDIWPEGVESGYLCVYPADLDTGETRYDWIA